MYRTGADVFPRAGASTAVLPRRRRLRPTPRHRRPPDSKSQDRPRAGMLRRGSAAASALPPHENPPARGCGLHGVCQAVSQLHHRGREQKARGLIGMRFVMKSITILTRCPRFRGFVRDGARRSGGMIDPRHPGGLKTSASAGLRRRESTGRTIAIPAISQRVLYYQVKYRNASNTVLAADPLAAAGSRREERYTGDSRSMKPLRPQGSHRALWPDGKSFAFTVFDDPDSQTLEAGREVYAFLASLGFRTTKGGWPIRGSGTPADHGGTCAEPAYRAWVQDLQRKGFEIGLHNATLHTSDRQQTQLGLQTFAEYFGGYPVTMAQHYYCDENIYWGDQRLSGLYRLLYSALTRGQNRNRFHGHIPGHPEFWGDLCRQHIRYVRNFAFAETNTLRACPYMPYHDPDRPYVNYWYASAEGATVQPFLDRIIHANLDRLEADGGACIMYTHFGLGFWDGRIHPRFAESMTRLARRNGWFVPVSELLDYLLAQRGGQSVLQAAERRELERRWLLHKVRFGNA